MSDWTQEPPEEEGWYWIHVQGQARSEMARISSGPDDVWVVIPEERTLCSFVFGNTKETVHRSRQPLTPLPFGEDDAR